MLTKQRQTEIVNIIKERGSVTTSDLAGMLGISESTARRDINSLDDMGIIKKVYGGAMINARNIVDTKEESYDQKVDINSLEKSKAAEKALAEQYFNHGGIYGDHRI